MSLAAKIRRAPLRAATGAFILNSGVSKLKAGEDAARGIHGMAANAYPFLSSVKPPLFLKALTAVEIGVGAALLLPIVPAGLAGLALTAFSGGLVGLYILTPAMHDSKMRPNEGGTAVAKDIWMAGIGISLVIDAALAESPVTRDTVS